MGLTEAKSKRKQKANNYGQRITVSVEVIMKQKIVKISVPSDLVDVLQSGESFSIEAKVRFSRQLYSSLRVLVPEYNELRDAVVNGYDQRDDKFEMFVDQERIKLLRQILMLMGFNPFWDPEHGCKELR